MAVACRTRGEASQRGNNEKLDTWGRGGGVGAGAGDGGGLAEGVEGRFESRFLDLDMKEVRPVSRTRTKDEDPPSPRLRRAGEEED
jgi:hypothetical protein